MRLSGGDRYQTNLALALTLRGEGDFPYDTPDRSSAGAPNLASADDWWGVGRCPRAIIVVAGDVPADVLAASALSDPTGESTEPYLQRTAAADPLFDPIGGFARVDTDFAPVLITRSARQGATNLTTATRIAARDLRSGGCSLARQAIVVGGTSAVPAAVDAELVSIGYDEVFRVEGADRWATAAAVAQALGTAATSATACADGSVDDGDARMAFYANSVVELRDAPGECRLLSRTVVLADGVTGADALAAGWWTSFWQVPVVLHDGSEALPDTTAAALQTMSIDHLVVLGGPGRIGDGVVAEAVALTGAEVIRLGGADRFETSVMMAQRLGGWWATGRGDEFEASLVCVAASSGNGPAAVGWPDALGLGPWCGALNGAAANPGAPERALAPTSGASPSTTAGGPGRPGHDAVPVLLVPARATALPDSVADLLAAAFEPTDDWCSSASAAPGCLRPGFAVVAGGATMVPSPMIDQVSELVAGGSSADPSGRSPRLDPPFVTSLDVTPVYAVDGAGPWRVCLPRDGYADLRWLAVFADAAAGQLLAATDLMLSGRYLADGDTTVRAPGVGAPSCVAVNASGAVTVRGVGLSGRATVPTTISVASANRFELTAPVVDASPDGTAGVASDLDDSAAGDTVRTFVTASPAVGVVSRGTGTTVTSASITLVISRGTDAPGVSGPDRFTATWSLTTPLGVVSGTAEGEALLVSGVWHLRGRAQFTPGGWNVASGAGGFQADVATGLPGLASDDQLAWRIDGSVVG